MTLDDANAVGAIVATADGRCSTCVGGLVHRLRERFPEFTWVIEPETYREDWMEEDGERDTVRAYEADPR